MKYASIYDSFTITVIMQLEDLGFCEKGQGGRFVSDGNLIAGVGKLPFNTDGGGLVQQPPVEPRRADQGIRGGAAVARRGAPGGAGQELRSGAGARHRRLARHPARRRDRDHGEGVTAMAQGQQPPGAQDHARRRSTWRRRPSGTPRPQGKLLIKKCTACGELHFYPRTHLPVLLQRQDRVAAKPRAGARSTPTA